MIIEHYSVPCYVISALCTKNMYGEDLPPNKRHYIYVLKEPYNCFGSLISDAKTFHTAENARQWWEINKKKILEDDLVSYDISTLKIRKRIERIVEEDVDDINLGE